MKPRLLAWRAVLFVSFGIAHAAIGACGSSAESVAATEGGRPNDATQGSNEGSSEAGQEISKSDGSKNDGSAGDPEPNDAHDDAAILPPPAPPLGTTKCGQGVLTPAAVVSACKTPPTFGPVPDDGCDLATSDGGHYEVWCGSTATYVWLEIDNLRSKGSCPVTSSFALAPNANYAYTSTGAGVGTGPATLAASGSVPYTMGAARSFVLTASIGASTNGSMTLWAKGIDSTCPTDAAHFGALVAGALVSW